MSKNAESLNAGQLLDQRSWIRDLSVEDLEKMYVLILSRSAVVCCLKSLESVDDFHNADDGAFNSADAAWRDSAFGLAGAAAVVAAAAAAVPGSSSQDTWLRQHCLCVCVCVLPLPLLKSSPSARADHATLWHGKKKKKKKILESSCAPS